MKHSLVLTLALWTGAASASPDAMTFEEARHLVGRTGFGAAPEDVAAMVGLSYAEGVQILLDGVTGDPVTPMPAWADAWAYPGEQIWLLGQTETERFYTNRWLDIEELSVWWLSEMAVTPSPLTERLTLFWHDHFATSYDAAENPQWMAQQNAFFRAHAAGEFAELARGILRDPAMLTYLSNEWNVKDAPNEDLGREYLELFTLGEGRGYDQADVRAAAAMLTGHSVTNAGTPDYMFRAENHDRSVKTLFGQSGRFGADDLTTLVLNHPEFGPYIVEKLWLEFVSDQPDAAEVARLTEVWRGADWDLKPLLQEMFLTDAFWDPANRGRLVKSPVHLVVGTVRSLGVPIPDARDAHWAAEEMGQMLFFPPNVGGWPTGIGWINDATATTRATIMADWAEAMTYGLKGDDPVMPMMAAGPATDPVQAGVTDLRVGQVFAEDGWQEEDWLEAMITLYDVSFAGQTWRSLPLYVTYATAEDLASLDIFTGDCARPCLQSLPASDEPGWVRFEPWNGFLTAHEPISADDRALLAAVAAHLPALLQSTAKQQIWQDAERDFALSDVASAVDRLAADTALLLGPPEGSLVRGFSQADALGLTGRSGMAMGGDIDAYAEEEAALRRIPMVPRQTFETGGDWRAALPGQGPQTVRARTMLWALPEAPAMRDALVEGDPEALIRHLILSPEYQLY